MGRLRIQGHMVVPLVVVVVLLAATAAAACSTASRERDVAQRQFEADTYDVQEQLAERWKAQEQVLRAGVGFVSANPNVTRAEWATFVSGLALDENYPGIQGVGLSMVLDPDTVAQHEAAVQADLGDRVDEPYNVYPVPGNQHAPDLLTSIVYLEPFDLRNQQAIGLDMWSEENRRQAMALARDTGDPALSGKILLVQEITTDVQPGFLLYLPLYEGGVTPPDVAQRQEKLIGWVYSPFRATDLLVQAAVHDAEVAFSIYDGPAADPEALLYSGSPSASSDFAATRTLEIAGHEWTIVYRSSPGFDADATMETPLFIGGVGAVVSLLAGAVIWSQNNTTRKAQAMANSITKDLQDKTAALAATDAEKTAIAQRLSASNEELKQFAYVASHDLQEPARTVQTYLSLIQTMHGDRLPPEVAPLIEDARLGAERMRKMIQDLLAYSTVQASVAADARADMNAVAKEVMAALGERVTDGKATITIGELPVVKAEPAAMVRVLTNLIANALNHAGESANITVSATYSDGREQIEVADDGPGIDPDVQARLFAMFARGKDSHGTGLGLAICKRIIDKAGGSIGVRSRPGHGAVFWFSLPGADA